MGSVVTEWEARQISKTDADYICKEIVKRMEACDQNSERRNAYADVLELLRVVTETRRVEHTYYYRLISSGGEVLFDSRYGEESIPWWNAKDPRRRLYRTRNKERTIGSAKFACKVFGEAIVGGVREIYMDGKMCAALPCNMRSIKADSYDMEYVKGVREAMGME